LGWDRTGEASLQRPRDTPCRGRLRTGHAELHRRQGHGAAGGVAQAIVNSVESEGGYCSAVTAERRAPVQWDRDLAHARQRRRPSHWPWTW